MVATERNYGNSTTERQQQNGSTATEWWKLGTRLTDLQKKTHRYLLVAGVWHRCTVPHPVIITCCQSVWCFTTQAGWITWHHRGSVGSHSQCLCQLCCAVYFITDPVYKYVTSVNTQTRVHGFCTTGLFVWVYTRLCRSSKINFRNCCWSTILLPIQWHQSSILTGHSLWPVRLEVSAIKAII